MTDLITGEITTSERENSSELWNAVQKIKVDVFKGDAVSPEERSIAWRVAESQGDQVVIEKIKNDMKTPGDRFDLSYQFLTEGKETEGDLGVDGFVLNPVPKETVQYMVDGLMIGIDEVKQNVEPDLLALRLESIVDIASRCMYGVLPTDNGAENKDIPLGATYLTKNDLLNLLERISEYALFYFSKGLRREGEFESRQRSSLETLKNMYERIK
jgi:hypothetical protein